MTDDHSLFTSSINPFAINLNNMVEEEVNSHSQTSSVLVIEDESHGYAGRDLIGEKVVLSSRLPITKVPSMGYRRTKPL